MYAIFEDGSRQYRVQEGDTVTLDYREADKGTRLEFSKVLLYQNGDDTRIGRPLVEGVRVLADVLEETSKKYHIQKYRRRKNYRKRTGHRQKYTQVKISKIVA